MYPKTTEKVLDIDSKKIKTYLDHMMESCDDITTSHGIDKKYKMAHTSDVNLLKAYGFSNDEIEFYKDYQPYLVFKINKQGLNDGVNSTLSFKTQEEQEMKFCSLVEDDLQYSGGAGYAFSLFLPVWLSYSDLPQIDILFSKTFLIDMYILLHSIIKNPHDFLRSVFLPPLF